MNWLGGRRSKAGKRHLGGAGLDFDFNKCYTRSVIHQHRFCFNRSGFGCLSPQCSWTGFAGVCTTTLMKGVGYSWTSFVFERQKLGVHVQPIRKK